MEIPAEGQSISWCKCMRYSCNSPVGHLRLPHDQYPMVYIPKHCVIPDKSRYLWTIYNLGFVPEKTIKLNDDVWLYIGSKIAVCVPAQIKPGTHSVISVPPQLRYYDNFTAVYADYPADELRVYVLEERVARLEEIIATHLSFAPGGEGYLAAAASWNAAAK